MKRILGFLTVACSLPGLAAASDYWVDAVHGDDAASGAHALVAWRTLSHALSAIPAGAPAEHVLHVAPGTYDVALGESFPLLLRGDVSVVSEGGSRRTFLVGDGSGPVLAFSDFGRSSRLLLQGLDLSGGTRGLDYSVGEDAAPDAPILRDLRVHSNAAEGILLTAAKQDGDVRLEGCELYANGSHGLSLNVFDDSFDSTLNVTLADTSIHANGGDGVYVEGCGHTFVDLRMQRCSVELSAGWGIELFMHTICGAPVGDFEVILDDTAVLANTGGGIQARPFTAGPVVCELRGCTVAANGGVGVDNPSLLANTILWGNGDDVVPGLVPSVSYCNIEDGDFAGSNGNVSLAPGFAAGGYELASGSPMIDAGDPLIGPGGTDAGGHPRLLDGDLDGTARLDIGFDEYGPVTLALTGLQAPGAAGAFALSGPTGWAFALFTGIARADVSLGSLGSALLLPSPRPLAIGALPAAGPLSIPPRSALAGLELHFQALALDLFGNAGSTSNRVSRTLFLPRGAATTYR